MMDRARPGHRGYTPDLALSPDFSHWLGMDRVVRAVGAMPQGAEVLDATPVCHPLETLLSVDRLVLDATSMRHLRTAHGETRVAEAIMAIVRERGKMHNPVTGSGGVACGTIREIGAGYPRAGRLAPGTRVVSMGSLTLTPLHLDRVLSVDTATAHIHVVGTAVVFASVPLMPVPDDLPLDVTLAVLDVAGAPVHVRNLAAPGSAVLVMGAGGNAGLLSLVAARQAVGRHGQVIAVEARQEALAAIAELDVTNAIIHGDATNPVATAQQVAHVLRSGADLTVSVVNVAGAEAACYLCTKPEGTVLYFSMATSFSQAALGAEGIGATARLLIGNGFAPDHGRIALEILRSSAALRRRFIARHGEKAR